MPRRRVPNVSVPRRLDGRRPGGNAISAQHRPPRGRRGQVETIAERRVVALRLRRTGASYREIAGQLAVDVATAYADVRAELAALREQTVEEAKELRDLELQRFDEMTAGLWPQVRAGSAPHVTAAVRVSERPARLLGLDAPTEISASLSVDAARRLTAETEDLQRWLTFEELRELGEKSERLFADARALVQARRTPMLISVSPSAAADIDHVTAGEPAEQSAVPTLTDQRDAAGAETAPPDTP